MKNSLCCCEYIDKDGEQSHILASLCNCEAVDEAFDRLVTCRSFHDSIFDEICNTLGDRLRIPWPGGAKKINFYSFLSWLILPSLIYLGSINLTVTVITYLLILPMVLYICHRHIKNRIKYFSGFNTDLGSYISARNGFYPSWLMLSLILTLSSIFILIFETSKISSLENLLLISLCVFSSFSFHNTYIKGRYSFVEDIGGSYLNFEDAVTCNICLSRVLKDATHCKYCVKCFSLRDHHCFWLNTCIHRANDRWFITGLFIFYGYLIFHAYLTFTTVCHPKKLNILFGYVLYPWQCPNAYFDFSFSIATSIGCYALVIAVYCFPIVLQLVFRISFGKRRPRSKMEKNWRPRFFWNIVNNWYEFWFT